jgi:VanZ family protein
LFFFFLVLSIIGFMVKLPSVFRHYDKELHSLFYFLAAAFLNILFAKKRFTKHILIFAFLYLLGMSIEYAQEYSNQFFRKRIHGRYDKEDVLSNLKGLITFSVVWVIYVGIAFFIKKPAMQQETDKSK